MLVLQTPRLKLVQASFDDAEFIYQLLNEKTFIDNIVDKGVRTLDDARNYIQKSMIDSYSQNGFGLYVARLIEDDTPIGTCGLLKRDELEWPEVGYAFLPQYTGRGYASEGAKAALDYGRNDLGIKKIVAITTDENTGSIKVLNKIGLFKQKVITIYDDECGLYY